MTLSVTDVDECTTSFPCSHYCNNTLGSFKCFCAAGFSLSANKQTCLVNGGKLIDCYFSLYDTFKLHYIRY